MCDTSSLKREEGLGEVERRIVLGAYLRLSASTLSPELRREIFDRIEKNWVESFSEKQGEPDYRIGDV